VVSLKTPEDRLRKIRSLLKQTDAMIECLPYMADQTEVLRAALVEIAKVAGPTMQPKEKKNGKSSMVYSVEGVK